MASTEVFSAADNSFVICGMLLTDCR